MVGCVESRSSSSDGGAPSESEIHDRNPQREEKIRKATCWQRLERGSLNLRVDENDVARLTEVKSLIFERPDEVCYPAGNYKCVPEIRRGWSYYLATATIGRETQEVLVRRAVNPLKGIIELYAEVNLRVHFGLVDGDTVQVTFP